jgi:hypothetical protein
MVHVTLTFHRKLQPALARRLPALQTMSLAGARTASPTTRSPAGPKAVHLGALWETGPAAAMTVVVLDAPATRLRMEGAVTALAELAVTDELLVVYGWDENRPRVGLYALMNGLRERLPRHTFLTVHVEPDGGMRNREIATVEELLEDGSVPVVITGSAALRDVAAEFTARLPVDRVLGISYRPKGGAVLLPLWDRRQPTLVGALAG